MTEPHGEQEPKAVLAREGEQVLTLTRDEATALLDITVTGQAFVDRNVQAMAFAKQVLTEADLPWASLMRKLNVLHDAVCTRCEAKLAAEPVWTPKGMVP
jgi:hypothetical protein